MWVEVDGPCEVEILGCTERTFEVEGHHFALVHVTGLPEEGETPYEVALDGERVWPPADWQWPASCVRTLSDNHGVRICFGSCRCAYPHEPPWTLTKDEDPEGREHDALRALALRMRDQEPGEWPHLLLMLGDQVYADEVAPATQEFIRARRDVDVPPGLQIADYEEYCRLYHDSWSEPAVRWLLSTVPTAMIFDDHDVIDDWNTSRDWVAGQRAKGWWDERIVGAFMSYWCYQHLGNLSPEDREEDACYRAVRAADGDAAAIVRDFAFRADREVAGARWSYKRDIGRTRIVMMDSRAGRVLEPGARAMVDAEEWDCIVQWTRGDFDHLLLGTSLPVFLGRGMHYLEAWNEAVSDGAWGRLASGAAERMRQGLDLEHWAAFGDSLRALERLLGDIASRAPRQRAGDRRAALRRRAPRLHRRRAARRRPAPVAGVRLPGGVLAAAQPAGLQRAARDQARDDAGRRARRARPGPRGGRGGRAADLGDRRRALVRQPGGHPRPRRTALHVPPGERAWAAATSFRGSSRPPFVAWRRPLRVCSRTGDRMDQGEAITTAARALREQELLRRIHEQGDARARDQLAEEMLPLARALAGRYANRGEPLDDLVQVACIGIMKAIDGFDLTREVRFSSYATPTVLGEIKRHFRDKTWAMRVPRGLQELQLRVAKARDKLTHELGRSPTVQEIATAVEAPFEEVLATIQSVSARRTRSLDEPTGEDVTLADSLGTVDPEIERAEMRALLDGAFDVLSERDQEVLRLRFEHDLTQTEIAQRIGVSQMQVSRLIRQSLARMRMDIERSPERKSRVV